MDNNITRSRLSQKKKKKKKKRILNNGFFPIKILIIQKYQNFTKEFLISFALFNLSIYRINVKSVL